LNKEFEIFIDDWHQIVVICYQMTLALSFLIITKYALVFTAKRNSAEKYRFMNENEIKYFWYTGLSLSISFGLFLNSLIVRTHLTYSVFVFKMAISLGIVFAIAYAISTYLNEYYPFRLEKRLSRLRFKKRISPKTGKEMRLLNEEEGDVHLPKEMVKHEHFSAYDCDVWIDDETGFKLIEQYAVDSHALLCTKCKFRTLKKYREELIKEPTYCDSGSVKKFYKCSYCDHLDENNATVAPLGN
jgi:hypothetical protein